MAIQNKRHVVKLKPADDRFSSQMRWWLPGMRVKRYLLISIIGLLAVLVGVVHLAWQSNLLDNFLRISGWSGFYSDSWVMSGLAWIIFGVFAIITGLRLVNRSLLSVFVNPDIASQEVFIHRRLETGGHIVALGGGTGLSRMLSGIKLETSNATAIVAISDDGGSTGRLRNAFDIPAVGDLVDCLAALSSARHISDLMEYRFSRGGELAGHTFGNLMLTSLSELNGDFANALRQANEILRLRGAVWPASYEAAKLWARRDDDSVVEGESKLRFNTGRIVEVGLNPENVEAMPEAVRAIRKSELILLGPGSLYSSVIPSFLPIGIKTAILESNSPLVYVVNVMSEVGETEGMTAIDYCTAVCDHLGRFPDWVIVNTAPISEKLLQRYEAEGQHPVGYSPGDFNGKKARVIAGNFLEEGYAQHDPEKVVRAVMDKAKA